MKYAMGRHQVSESLIIFHCGGDDYIKHGLLLPTWMINPHCYPTYIPITLFSI